MASMIRRIVLLVTVLCIYQYGPGFALQLEIVPDTINELIKDEIKITCTAKDLDVTTQKVMVIELGKDGQPPIAILDCDKEDIEVKAGLRTRIQAEGHIDKDVKQSYLRLTIKKYLMEDIGVYSCKMFYLDTLGQMNELRANASLFVDNNYRHVIAVLLNRVSELERMNTDIQEKLIVQQNQSEHQIEEQRIKLEKLEERASYTTAFSVGYDIKDKIHKGRTVLFTEQIMEIGNNYNNETGIFTAPVTGLYVFHLTVMSHGGNNYVYIDLKANNKVVASLYPEDDSTSDQTSASTIVLLKTGEEVKPVVKGFYGVDYLHYVDHYSVFTGYLLKPL